MRRTGALLALSLAVSIGAPGRALAVVPSISIGTINAQAGEDVLLPVSLDLGTEPFVRGIRNDIFWDLPGLPILVHELENGQPDCTPDPDLITTVPVQSNFACFERSTEGPCVRLRGQVISQKVPVTLPTGTIYSCVFHVAESAVPGTYALRMNRQSPGATPLATWFDQFGDEQSATGIAGAIVVVEPSPTPTDTSTLAPTDTETPTVSPTPTVTPTTSPSSPTPTPAVLVRALGGQARPGSSAAVSFDFTDRTHSASELTFDLLLDDGVFSFDAIQQDCRLDARLPDHSLSVVLFEQPPPPAGLRRVRIALFDPDVPAAVIGDGPLMTCDLPVRADAPEGLSAITFERAFAGTGKALIPGVQGRAGAVVIDLNAPSPTATASFSVTPTVTPTPPASSTPSRTASRPPASRTPTPSPIPIGCTGDCDESSEVEVAEAIRCVDIGLGLLPMDECPALDANQDGAAEVDELVAAIANVLHGCPGVAAKP